MFENLKENELLDLNRITGGYYYGEIVTSTDVATGTTCSDKWTWGGDWCMEAGFSVKDGGLWQRDCRK